MNLLEKAFRSKFNLSYIQNYVRRYFENYAIRMMHYFGFYVEELPSMDLFYSKVKDYPVVIKENELIRITTHIGRANDHKMYNLILNRFVPEMNINYSYNKFIGFSNSEISLRVYRKVIVGDDILFEKVYFNSSDCLLRVKWFHENIYTSLNNYVKTPQLFSSIRGELITVVFFKFVHLIPLFGKDVDENIFNLSRQLYKLSLLSEVKDKFEDAPDFIKDYKGHIEYVRKIEKAKNKAFELFGDKFPFQNIEMRISESPHILTHGDMHRGNIYKNNYLIDWDDIGIYPIGLEVAYILLFFKQCKMNYKELNHILETEYRSTILEDEWDDFELNSLFFYFVFTVQPLEEMDLNEVQMDILNRVNELFFKKELKAKS